MRWRHASTTTAIRPHLTLALSWPRKEPLVSVLQGYAAQLRGALESSAPAPLQ